MNHSDFLYLKIVHELRKMLLFLSLQQIFFLSQHSCALNYNRLYKFALKFSLETTKKLYF